MASDIDLIWVSGEAEYFLKSDWTGQIRLMRLNKFRFWRNSAKPVVWVERQGLGMPSLASDTHQSQFAKMMGFAKGSTHPSATRRNTLRYCALLSRSWATNKNKRRKPCAALYSRVNAPWN
jgi:hypothetical protein